MYLFTNALNKKYKVIYEVHKGCVKVLLKHY